MFNILTYFYYKVNTFLCREKKYFFDNKKNNQWDCFSSFINETIESKHKNTPKAILNVLLGTIPAINAPKIEKIIPEKIIIHIFSNFKYPFLLCKNKIKLAIIINDNKLIAWLYFCPIFNSIVRSGINIVPPPIPNPPITPEITPNKMYKKYNKILLILLILSPQLALLLKK